LSLGAVLVFWVIVMPGLRIEFDRTLRQIPVTARADLSEDLTPFPKEVQPRHCARTDSRDHHEQAEVLASLRGSPHGGPH